MLSVDNEALPFRHKKLATVEQVVAVKESERDVHSGWEYFGLRH